MGYLVCGNLISIAFGTLIASFLLDVMDGILGFPAWRWLFFVEGGLTVLAATTAIFILPDFPETKTIPWLSAAEHRLARNRMIQDRIDTPTLPLAAMTSFTLAVSDWKVWYLAAAMYLSTLSTSFIIFFPTLTATMGYNTTISLLLCVPPWLTAAASSLWLSRHSDKTQERCMHVIIPFSIAISGFLLAMVTMNTAVRYASL
jgi:MFS family permease